MANTGRAERGIPRDEISRWESAEARPPQRSQSQFGGYGTHSFNSSSPSEVHPPMTRRGSTAERVWLMRAERSEAYRSGENLATKTEARRPNRRISVISVCIAPIPSTPARPASPTHGTPKEVALRSMYSACAPRPASATAVMPTAKSRRR